MRNFERRDYQIARNVEKPIKNLYGLVSNEKWGIPVDDYMCDHGEKPQEKLPEQLRSFINSDFVKSLSEADKAQLTRAMNLDVKNSNWRYGVDSNPVQVTLFNDPPKQTRPMDYFDTYVLTGMLGHGIAQDFENLKQLGEQFEMSSLNQMITLGGVALAAYDYNDIYKYTTAKMEIDNGDLIDIIQIGGHTHHDFQASRSTEFVKSCIDPLGVSRPFGPKLPEKRIGAYHSSEPAILSCLLMHLCRVKGIKEAQKMSQEVIQQSSKFVNVPQEKHFDIDIRSTLIELQYRIKHFDEYIIFDDKNILNKFGIEPKIFNEAECYLQPRTNENGVDLDMTVHGEKSDGFHLANGEIKDFIMTLIRNKYTRTPAYVLLDILQGFCDFQESDLK
jgi:hypothetical protein